MPHRILARLAAIALACPIFLGAPASAAPPDPIVLDAFDAIDAWTADAPEGVTVTAHLDPDGADGSALRIDYEFVTGGGYCVVRRELDLPLPENYRFSYDLRGNGKANNLEFKIVGPSSDKGEDVWWVNRRAFHPPRDWTRIADKRRAFEFAWGPSGGTPLPRVVAIEIAIAMHEGGKGSLWLDNLTFEELPPPTPYTATPVVRTEPDATTIDFQQPRDLGAILLRWPADSGPRAYDLQSSADGTTWQTIATVRDAVGPFDAHRAPDLLASTLRIVWTRPDHRAALASFEALPLELGDDANAFITRVAQEAPRGRFPKQFTGKQSFWTVVGAPDSDHEGLFSEFGAYELCKGGPSLEPFLIDDAGSLITWADAQVTASLMDGYLPLPTVRWDTADLALEVTPIHPGLNPNRATTERVGMIRYRVTNTSDVRTTGTLAIAVRPFQVLPPWQRLNIPGGVSRLERLHIQGAAVMANDGMPIATALTPPDDGFAVPWADGDAVARLAAGAPTPTSVTTDPHGLASGALTWNFSLAPGASRDVILRIPTHRIAGHLGGEPKFAADWPGFFEFILQSEARRWRQLLNRATLSGPPELMHIWDSVRSNVGYVLINADGPAIQPGSRTYERSWIRDGSLTGTALLTMGHGDRTTAFLRWFSEHLYDSGKVPCVVDQRGPDPYPEHDSHGQYIYLLLRTALTTSDTDLAREYYPKALRVVDYIESLRNQRLTPEYADPTSDLHRYYGILPESGSHEGYMNKPMHSFWDDFFCLKGLKDIVRLAEIVGDTESLPRLIALRDGFRDSFAAAIRGAIDHHGIDYIPGCVELGDFDATSTAIGPYPCGEIEWLPQAELHRTFEKYWETIEGRRADTIPWHDYTPYETRIIGTFVLLDQPERALELLEWLSRDQLPKGWNQWAEVAYRDDEFPGWLGDVPHTWVGSGFISSVRTMLVFERERDQSLVLAAGVVPAWLDHTEGITVTQWPTEFGVLDYSLRREGNRLIIEATIEREPPGGLILRIPGDATFASANASLGAAESADSREVRLRGTAVRAEITLK
jgi:hypothetical protein